jgi:hypothetical protein
VTSSLLLRGNRVEVRAHADATVRSVRAVLQVGAVCGGGS